MHFPQNRDYTAIGYILAMVLVIFGCSRAERSEEEKIRRRNCKGEYIHRKHDEVNFPIAAPIHTPRSAYSWEGQLPQITKEFFRCKGSSTNPPILDHSDPSAVVSRTDCEGSSHHGLPIFRAQQGVYPILIEILNYVQVRTGKRVIITSGHRCPAHNTYVDPSKENKVSKYQIGAAVDFYVQGMEKRPQEVVQMIMDYYKTMPRYRAQKEFEEFSRYDKADAHVSMKPWFNKEIFIKCYGALEGRNRDNDHPYPYINLQVRYDRDTKERVVYDWKKANLGYPRD